MKFTVSTESIGQVAEAVKSKCDGIRFGSEFCEWKIPRLKSLEEAYERVNNAGKKFKYVTPILTNNGVEKVQRQIDFLKYHEDIEVVIGDIGSLNMLKDINLPIRLGRPRVYIPARSPWSQITRLPNPSFFARRKVENIFYQTSLNYQLALDYYKELGVIGADVDWITKSFQHYKKITRKGFNLAVHSDAIPIAVTMRCHMARFLEEEEPETCSIPCIHKGFDIAQKELDKEFTLNGNVVYRLVKRNPGDFRKVRGARIKEVVFSMGPVSKINDADSINELLTKLSGGA